MEPHFSLRSVVDPSSLNWILACAASRKILSQKQIQRVLQSKDVQVIFIASPNHLHAQHITQALRHGKHVYVEKPIVNTMEELHVVECEQKTSGKSLMVAHTMAYEGWVQKSRVLIPKVEHIQIRHHLPRNYSDWRSDPDCCHGGILSQLGLHVFDLISVLCGFLPEHVRIRSCTDIKNLEEINFVLSGSGVTAEVDLSFMQSAKYICSVSGGGAQVCYEDGILKDRNGEITYESGTMLDKAMQRFAQMIRSNMTNVVYARELLQKREEVYRICKRH